MSAKSVNDAIQRINRIIEDIKAINPKLELYAANQAQLIILRRIFNTGKDSTGALIGKYDDKKKQKFLTKQTEGSLTKKKRAELAKKRLGIGKNNQGFEGFTYKELREFRGLQTAYVDLQFTGRLFESIQVVQSEGKFILAIVYKDRAKIADYMEKKYKKTIFTLGKDEKLQLMEKVNIFAKAEISKIIKKWSK